MKDLFIVNDNGQFAIVNGEQDSLLQHGFFMAPFVIETFDDGPDEVYLVRVYSNVINPFENADGFINRTMNEACEWFSNKMNLPRWK